MTVPHPLQLFSPAWYEPVNTRTQVDRMPGTDAPCLCTAADRMNCAKFRSVCDWPFCGWKDKP